MTNSLDMIDSFIDSYVENQCLADALALKWVRLERIQNVYA